MDKFEQFIRDNRDELDGFDPPKDKMWAKIEEGLEPPKPKRNYSGIFMRVAAGVALLMGMYLLFTTTQNDGQQFADEAISEEEQYLNEVAQHYEKLVATKVEMIESIPLLPEADKEELLDFLTQLEEEHEQLKKELENNINTEAIEEAIIDNYRRRVKLLDALLERIDEEQAEQLKGEEDGQITL